MDDAAELNVISPSAGRGPVTTGIPWPRGKLLDPQKLVLRDASGKAVRLQARATDRWPDGSVRWVLLDWIAEANAGPYRVAVGDPVVTEGPEVMTGDFGFAVDADGTQHFPLHTPFLSDSGVQVWYGNMLTGPNVTLSVVDDKNRRSFLIFSAFVVEEPGPTRTTLFSRCRLVYRQKATLKPFAEAELRLHYFASPAVVRIEFTIRNPRRAAHPGGRWDLGDSGSIFFKNVALTFALPTREAASVYCSPEIGAPVEEFSEPFELYQDSSGGENWRSTNHMNRKREVPLSFRGYRLKAGKASSPSPLAGEGSERSERVRGETSTLPPSYPSPVGEAPPPSPARGEGKSTERTGLRATPLVTLSRGEHAVGVAVPHFWQNFPMAVDISENSLTLHLFPRQSTDVHELQGGEQKTHTFAVAFGPDAKPEALEWFRQPARAFASPKWYCDSGAIPYLTPKADDPNAEYLALVDAAIEGPDSFDHKREVIDEYGRRHFGDIYGDHEAVYHTGPAPMVSHYNNQYDPVAGFAYQLMRSADLRWLRHMDELAAHVIDIDIYHTTRDKSAYNGGLFWHTFHYVDADTGTHRSYPRSLLQLKGMPGLDPNDPKAKRSKSVYALGGGPANEHNYTTGLMLHHFLTGSAASREAALGLARWVIDMDDGRKTVFRWLARGDTGYASQSRDAGYHGPGRGSGNSLSALLDGHRLSGDPAFLAKAEQIVRRCIHPADDVPKRNLLDVENRWFYTMFLQSLGKYLDHKAERGDLDRMYAYARASLLHYAGWMAEHEVPTLSRPEVLEYPNETWAAQDMRKSEVFKFAAKHATGAEKDRFLERADFFFRDAVSRLTASPTRTLARPVVLMLSFGYMHAHFQWHPNDAAPAPAAEVTDFGKPEAFIPQKVIAKKRAKLLAAAGAACGAAAVAALAGWLLLR